jgi:hypothetical protein
VPPEGRNSYQFYTSSLYAWHSSMILETQLRGALPSGEREVLQPKLGAGRVAGVEALVLAD